MSHSPRLADMLRSSAGETRRAPAERVTTVLGAPRVPLLDRCDEPTKDLSPMARVVLALQDADPLTASCAVRLIEAYVSLDADRKVLLMAVAQTFRERCDRAG